LLRVAVHKAVVRSVREHGRLAQRGTITELTPASELAQIPGVVTATNHYQVGDIITGQMTSIFHACTLLFDVGDTTELAKLKHTAAGTYQLAVT
jgi:hypothetical protein